MGVRQAIEGYLFLVPWIVGFIVFTAGPLAASLVLSFYEWPLIRPARFVGLRNYATMLGADPLFWKSLRVTFVYVLASVPLQLAFALFLALLLNERARFQRLFRTVYFLPSVVSGVALSVLWLWLYHPELGLINQALGLVGIEGPPWLLSPRWALSALVGMSLWTVGVPMLIFLAGLQGVPQELYEAAAIDGAGEWSKFKSITIPMLSPAIFFNLVLGFIVGFQTFTQAFVMTGGGPLNSTLLYALYTYINAFTFLKMGYASALAWVMFVLILAWTWLMFRVGRRWVYYEAGRP
ncbi:MAG: carbohydrate ABC transporter permease [Acidimicrobiia bacterium]